MASPPCTLFIALCSTPVILSGICSQCRPGIRHHSLPSRLEISSSWLGVLSGSVLDLSVLLGQQACLAVWQVRSLFRCCVESRPLPKRDRDLLRESTTFRAPKKQLVQGKSKSVFGVSQTRDRAVYGTSQPYSLRLVRRDAPIDCVHHHNPSI